MDLYNDIALLFLRLGIGYLYLYAAYMNSRNKAAVQWTIDNTAILFRNTRLKDNARLIRVVAIAGIFMMYIGGISVLADIEAWWGAILLFAFTAGGTIIHRRLQKDALDVANASGADPKLSGMAWSAYSAHFANILKNRCLLLVLLFFVIQLFTKKN